jgi:small-conductance mechanosensitive channel
MHALLKSRQWLTVIALVVLVLAAVIAAFFTRDGANQASTAPQTRRAPVVDERPTHTADAVMKLSSSWDEQRFANQINRAADHEVDLAFADALRDAKNHPAAPTPQTQELYSHLNKAQQQANRDQALVDQFKKLLTEAKPAERDTIQDELDLAQAQLELDQDDIDSATTDLIRSGADKFSRVQRQFKRHEDAEHTADANKGPTGPTASPVNYQAGNLWGQIVAWQSLHAKSAQLKSARAEADEVATKLGLDYAQLQQQLAAEKSSQASNAANAATTVAALKLLAEDQKTLADLGKRLQDISTIQGGYDSWLGIVALHQRAAIHGMIESALWILLIVLCVYLADRAVDHYLGRTSSERTRLHTLRAVIRFAIQAIGVLFILLVIFGIPQQMPTILGFAGAGLTVACKDFIVAFFGWFVLMGKNGLRVGDWVEINGVAGEVIEINLLRTVLLETGNWTSTGHPTGRKVAFVNSYAIEGHFFNFTTSGQWLWDELQVMVPADQDPYALIEAVQQAVTRETEENARSAEKEWQNVTGHYKVQSVAATPTVNLRPTASGMEIHVRYIARAQERSAIRARINQAIVDLMRNKSTASASARR